MKKLLETCPRVCHVVDTGALPDDRFYIVMEVSCVRGPACIRRAATSQC